MFVKSEDMDFNVLFRLDLKMDEFETELPAAAAHPQVMISAVNILIILYCEYVLCITSYVVCNMLHSILTVPLKGVGSVGIGKCRSATNALFPLPSCRYV